MKYTLILSALVALASATTRFPGQAKHHTDFTGQQVVTIVPQNEAEMAKILKLGEERGGVEKEGDFDIWDSHGIGQPTDIRVTAEQKKELEDLFGADRLEVTIEDVQALINSFNQKDTKKKGERFAANEYHEEYHPIDEINDFIYQLEEDYSDLVTVSTIGESYQGNDILMACISYDGCDGSKPTFFLDAGVHAREWIAHATALYVFENLLIESTQAGFNNTLLNRMDFLIVPQMNPDGYQYSRSSRMWRKSRMPTSNPSCTGTDLNRNWEYEWGGVGASTNPCSDTYRGGYANDNPEVAIVQEAALNATSSLVYIDTHSYGNYFLTPWGYTSGRAPDTDDHIACAKAGADALYAVNQGLYGGYYVFGPSGSTLYPTSGSAPDTVYSEGMGSAKYSITVELPGRVGTRNYGFCMPPEYIIPICEETWAAYKAIAEFALANP
jgi:murein tripeptide amidase MpaA